ncbi:DUF4114 domain-containing protein, partial [Moorena sp. SIO3I8]|uniref:DUF4114 domain-containing protein n=1 Tax=Moorena sp. SIO3I8 TaxID=2607833 RepID=UPI0013BF45B5
MENLELNNKNLFEPNNLSLIGSESSSLQSLPHNPFTQNFEISSPRSPQAFYPLPDELNLVDSQEYDQFGQQLPTQNSDTSFELVTGKKVEDSLVGEFNNNDIFYSSTHKKTDHLGDFFLVPGALNDEVSLSFEWTTRKAGFDNEIGVFVIDEQGRVNGITPDEPGYAWAALSHPTRQVLFSSGTGAGARREVTFKGGDRLAFYIIQDNTTDHWLERNPQNTLGAETLAFFSIDGVNPDGFDHAKGKALDRGIWELAWEDLAGGGDRDFNDVVIQVAQTEGTYLPGRVVQIPGEAGQSVATDFRWISRDAGYDNEMGLFLVDDASGGIGDLRPSDPGYALAALSSERQRVIFASGQTAGANARLELPAQAFFGWYLIQNATTQEFLQYNPNNQIGKGPLAFFSLPRVNPEGFEHIQARSGFELAWEDLTHGGDGDFNDLVFDYEFGTPIDTNINKAPTVLSLSGDTIGEKSPADTVIGTFSTTDPDAEDTHTYSLVLGDGDTDNNAFTIVDNELRINSSPDFETKSSYSIRVQTTDAGGLSYEQIFNISVTNVNEAPTVLNLSGDTIAENEADNTVIGTFTTTDPDVGDTHTYSLVTGDGDTDNNAFTIVNNELRINQSPDFETKSSYSIRVQTTDAGGLSYEQIFNISVTNVNEAPTVLNLSGDTIAENEADNTVIGTFTTTDPDAGDTHTYSLVTGDGDADNNAFTIVDNELRINQSPDFETKSSYSIRVQTTDAGGLSYEQIFNISVTNVNEAPIITVPGTQSVDEFTSSTISGISIEDVDAGDGEFTVILSTENGTLAVTPTTGVIVTEAGRNLTLAGNTTNINVALATLNYQSDRNFSGNDTLTLIANDLGNMGVGGANEVTATIPITVAAINFPPVADEDKLLTVEQNSDAISLAIAAPTDPDGDSLTITVDEIPAADKGEVKLGDTLVTTGQVLTLTELQALEFVPVADVTGNGGQFSYTVDDGQGGTDTQTITFNISPVIVLREGDNFKVVHEEAIAIPETPSLLRFTYNALNFDTTDSDFINDAFEVALLGADGRTLVHSIGNNQDVFFNFTEEQSTDVAPGVTLEKQTVSVDLSNILGGTPATVVFRLVNNDSDTETTVRITNLEIVPNQTPTNVGVTPTVTSSPSGVPLNILQLDDVSASTQGQYLQTSFNEQSNILTVELAIENIGSYGLNAPLVVAINQLSDPTIRVINADGFTPDGLPYYDFSHLVGGGTLDPGELNQTQNLSYDNAYEVQFTYGLVFLSELN